MFNSLRFNVFLEDYIRLKNLLFKAGNFLPTRLLNSCQWKRFEIMGDSSEHLRLDHLVGYFREKMSNNRESGLAYKHLSLSGCQHEIF